MQAFRSSFFEFGKILPHPREFDHHFCPGAGELDKEMPRWPGFARSKNFPGGRRGGGGGGGDATQLELTETLQF